MRLNPSEAEFQDAVMEALCLFGWRAVHYRPARTSRGWRTALQGDQGAPDIIAVRAGYLLALELKAEKGKVSPEQRAWIAELAKVPGCIAAIVRPSQWRWLERAIQRPDLVDQL